MSDVEIVYPVPVDEADGWWATLATTFLEDAGSAQHARAIAGLKRLWDPDRHWGARADGRWVATLASWDRTLTIPAGEGATTDIAADALTMVTVAGTHRRRGLLTSMLSDSLQVARERGDAVSILWAAEWPIYGRFGYAPAASTARYVLNPRSPGASVAPADGGRLRQVDNAELGALAPAVFDAFRRLRAGNVDRGPDWWNRKLGLDGFPEHPFGDRDPVTIVHEGADGPDGFVSWTAKGGFDVDASMGAMGAIGVSDLVAANDTAYRNLWAYLTGLDLVGEIALSRRPIDEPLRWLLPDGRALRQVYAGDGLWLRLLDVPAALAARRYAVDDRLVLEVVDDDIGGYAAGRYVLEAGVDGAKCTPSTVDSADLVVHQRALAAAYLGETSLRSQRAAGLVDELTAGALRRADAMLATPYAPWCATGF